MKNHSLFGWPAYLLTIMITLQLSCSVNPVTGKKEFMLLSEQGELALGKETDPSIVSTYGKYNDERIQAFINEKGQQMARISHRPNLDYDFKVLDSPVVNAFAVPGGYVYFTRGILAHFNNEAEFAGVLGHEIGHITARHSARQYSKTMLAQVGFGLGMVLSEDFRQFSNLAQSGLGLLFLKFGRDAESQSDRLGVEYSTEIGYNSSEMANFFQTINRLRGESGQSIPTFMSTHPDPVDRYNTVHKLTEKTQKGRDASQFKVGRDSYLRMIDGLVYGEDPRQGYFDNNAFFHPELKFQFPIPGGWQTVNTPSTVQIATEDGKALIQMSLAQGANAVAAERTFQQNTDSIRIIDSRGVRVNGLPARMNLSDVQNLRVLSYFIEYGGRIYKFHGIASRADFNRYESLFTRTMQGFNELRDPARLNVKPERIKVKTVQRAGTFTEVMRTHNMDSKRFDELAVLNGMQLNDRVEANTLIKVVGE
ncbi:MAG: M48 family metalloprotease [Bacteroidota bacterium]